MPDDELDRIADELYALRPDEFAAARDEKIKEARTAKRAELARELAKLRRPTQSAWLINLLWRDQHDVLEQWLELGTELARAQAQASGAELRELTAQRRQVENGLLQQARALARQHGVDVSPVTEREAQDTLAAALAEPSVAEEIRTGRLVKPTSYAGFGAPIVAPVTRAAPAPRRPPAAAPAEPAERDEVAERRAQRARERRAAAEQRVREAQAALDRASEALAARAREVSEAEAHQRELDRRLEQARTEVRQLEGQVHAAEETARAAARRREDAADSEATAQRALERAQDELAALDEG